MLDENNVIPLYHQMQEKLKEKIKGGYWKQGTKVPSERELMEDYHVSRATVRKALSELREEGLIHRKQGVGTFVSEPKIVQDLIGELSFNLQATKKGLSPSSKVVHIALEENVPKRITDVFQLDSTECIQKIVRVRLVNRIPLIIETLYIPNKYAPNMLEQDLESIAVFEYLEKECNLNFTHSTLDIVPIAINEFEAGHLGVEIGKPALSLERVIYSETNAIALQKRIMRGDRGKFSLNLVEKSNKRMEYLVGFEFNS